MGEILVTGNALEFENIAHNASWRNFVFCDCGTKEFFNSHRRLHSSTRFTLLVEVDRPSARCGVSKTPSKGESRSRVQRQRFRAARGGQTSQSRTKPAQDQATRSTSCCVGADGAEIPLLGGNNLVSVTKTARRSTWSWHFSFCNYLALR